MRKALSLFMALLLMTGFAAGLQQRAAAQSSPTSGTTVLDASGNAIATVSIDSIQDPFEAYDSGYEPQRGFRYVLLTVTIENTGDLPFATQPYGFTVVDSDGFLATSAYLSYDPAATGLPEALPDEQIEAGDSVTGTVAFQLLAGAEISTIAYAPSYDRNYILASNASAPAAGQPISLLGEDGGEIGTITVGKVMDPVTGVDPSYAAPRGYHYLGILVTIENTSSRPLSVDPSRLQVIDDEGFVNSYYSVYRTEEATDADPDLQYADLAPGDSVTGLVTFSIFNDAAPAWLIWTDAYTQYLLVQTFEGAPEVQSIADIPTESTAAPSTPTAGETPVANETPTETANLSPECQELAAWSQELNAAINKLNGSALSVESAEDLEALTPDEINAQIDLLNDFLDDIEEIDTPEAAQDTYDALVDMVNIQVDGFQEALDAKENGEDLAPIYEDYNAQINDASETFATAASALDTMCPGI